MEASLLAQSFTWKEQFTSKAFYMKSSLHGKQFTCSVILISLLFRLIELMYRAGQSNEPVAHHVAHQLIFSLNSF